MSLLYYSNFKGKAYMTKGQPDSGRILGRITVSVISIFFLLVGILPVSSIAQNLPTDKTLLTPLEFKEKLKGPILSFPTPFTENYEINYNGIEKIINRALQYGCRIVALTSGNSK